MEPIPPKRGVRWGGAIAIFLLACIVFIVVGHWYWGHRNGRELARMTDALRAAGEPVLAVELNQPAVPDERNAVVLLREAAALIDREGVAWKGLDELRWPRIGSRLPMSEDERAVLGRAVDAHAAALPIVARAIERDGVDWGTDYTQGLNVFLPDLNSERALTTLLDSAALLAHDRGDDARALEYLNQIDFISRARGQQSTLVSYLVSCGMADQQARSICEIAPTLKVSDSDVDAVRAEQVRQLIDRLLEVDARREIFVRGLRGERVIQQDTMRNLLGGTMTIAGVAGPQRPPPPPRPTSRARVIPYLLSPVLKQDALVLLRHMNGVIAAARELDDWPAFRARIPSAAALREHWWRHPVATILLPSLDRAGQVHYRIVTQRRLAAMSLAIRLYALDHDGRLPASLDELVPAYLPSVPLDAGAGGAKTIGYVADPDRPRLYHVGENGKDDGGREPDPWASKRDNDALSDEVVHLKPQPRPPTTRPSDGE